MKTLTLLLISAAAFAQQPQIENAKLETRAFAGTVESQLRGFGAGPFWVGWSEPMIPGRHGDMCWSNGNNYDEGGHAANAPVRLEGQTTLVMLIRVESSQIDQIRLTSPDCRLDVGGLALYWLSNVPADASVAWLKTQVTGQKADRAIYPIAVHAGAAAEKALEEFTAASEPEKIRERAAFWLGNSRGGQAVDVLKRMLASDPSTPVREQVIFALMQSREASAVATVIDAARNDKTPQIRSKAMFWLARKAANKQTEDLIRNAATNDPDRRVKEQAVDALKQLPAYQGIPLLIDVAKNNPDPAVRKKAISSLGQSRDPQALDFFAQVLK